MGGLRHEKSVRGEKWPAEFRLGFNSPRFYVFSSYFVATKSTVPEFDTRVLRCNLADWFEANQRKLPWRTTRSVYRTVVSEFMLQQTQVTTVLPYFERWMAALPDFEALAAAKESTVLKLWEGLGYYRRARNLQKLAQEFVLLPTKPTTAVEWEKLPGIGPYTAAAVTSISFGALAVCVDGNVIRILARISEDESVFRDGSKAVRHFTPLADKLLDPAKPGRHNEAMMELGATVCTRANPRCSECPLLAQCAAGRNGTAAYLPRIERPSTEKRAVDRAWMVFNGKLLLHRIPETSSRMNGLFELPTTDQAGLGPSPAGPGELLATHQRSITRYRITERIFRPPAETGRVGESTDEVEWVPLSQIDDIAFSGPHRRWITALLKSER
jgi:A/G-specific adenine glycosylase